MCKGANSWKYTVPSWNGDPPLGQLAAAPSVAQEVGVKVEGAVLALAARVLALGDPDL